MKTGAGSQEPGARRRGITSHVSRSTSYAFTLIELLVVIAIMGLLAGLAMPAFNKLKPNVIAAATQKLLTDVGRARQLAISQHTTVFMVFVAPGSWTNQAATSLNPVELSKAMKLLDKQMVGYNFVSLRSIGDQPGRRTVRYLDAWRTLPEGTFIAWQKFLPYSLGTSLTVYTNGLPAFQVSGFRTNNVFPFPSETAPAGWTYLPFIGFNYLGQLVDASEVPTGRNELIPLSQGSVLLPRDSGKVALPGQLGIQEKPVGNTTNTFNIINIDWLTGRARVEHQELL